MVVAAVAAYSIDTFAPSAVAIDTSISPDVSTIAINVTGGV
jgi:hypothetical protein